jgi:trehalose-6-phosphate synthase
MADQIHKVLTMTPEESAKRWEKAFNHVKTHDATNWVTGFLGQLKDAYIEQQRGVPTVLPKLNVDAYSSKYTVADKRLFVVDYEGIAVDNHANARNIGCLGEWSGNCVDYSTESGLSS